MTECDDDSSRWWVSGRRERRFVGGGEVGKDAANVVKK